MSEYTKGPWKHEKFFPTSIWANDVWLATTNVGDVRTLEEKEANARLIAAAPELYEALSLWEAWTSDDDSRKPKGIYFDEIMEKVDAALAKARGTSAESI